MKTEPNLNAALIELYHQSYGVNNSDKHKAIREMKAESLYIICLYLQEKYTLTAKFEPLIAKIKTQFDQEIEFCKAINPYFKYNVQIRKLEIDTKVKKINSPVMHCAVRYISLAKITKDKYNLADSPASRALQADSIEDHVYEKAYTSFPTANAIQLQAHGKRESKNKTIVADSLVDSMIKYFHQKLDALLSQVQNIEKKPPQKIRPITTADILARDYYHLRGNPAMQIALTLDYFILHVNKLKDPNNQRYVEANLFQPGLLAAELKKEAFLSQFDHFLQTGKRFFTQQGQHTSESLQFFRLDWLVSRYYAQLKPQEGTKRLQVMHENLVKQISLSSNSNVAYILQQYLFLATIARIETGENSIALLEQSIQSYFYIMRHANPLILEDTAHHFEVERAIGRFKLFASQQLELSLREGVKKALVSLGISLDYGFRGTFPNYTIAVDKGCELKVDALKGIVYEKGLIKTGLPIAIQRHPLIKQLGLHEESTCLASPQGNYFIIEHKEGKVYLYYRHDALIIHKDWTINGKTDRYELQPLTTKHEAYYANKGIEPLDTNLPAVLTDGAMNYWKNTNPSDGKKGILVRNNIPVYLHSDQIKPITNEPLKQSCQLIALSSKESNILNAFESNLFIVAYGDKQNTFVHLSRYGLHFQINKASQKMINEATGEEVIDVVCPIHKSVASLVLEGKGRRRLLVPKMQFYGLQEGTVSDFYPVVHDKQNVIAERILKELWERKRPEKQPLWDYQDTEQYASFQLINGEPIADTPADALYLAYTYLVTNQPEKAWKILDDCTKRLGGLKGDPAELRYIEWICNSLPFLITNKDKPLRGTPPFIACKLKAMSLLSDYLLQGGTFDLRAPDISKNDANSTYAQYQYEGTAGFLETLVQTIYINFKQYQTMGRYLEQQYQLSKLERKRLLDYYYQSLPHKKPLGALGYQWTLLSFEALKEEEKCLIAQQKIGALSIAEQKRLAHIESQLKKLQAVQAVSTELELVKLDLSLPEGFIFKKNVLKRMDKDNVENKLMEEKGEVKADKLHKAIDYLSSVITDDDFIEYFPAYLQIAATPENDVLRKALLDFCTQTLIANRHLTFYAQNSNIPYLCNLLYRMAYNHNKIKLDNINTFKGLVHALNKSNVPPLEIYQAKDIYSKILATPEQIISGYKEQAHQPIRTTSLASQPLLVQMGIDEQLEYQEKLGCNIFLQDYQLIQNTLSQELAVLSANQGFDKEFALEEQAGKALINAERKRKELAKQLLEKQGLLTALQKSACEALAVFQKEADKFWNEALTIASQGPDDEQLAQAWNIDLESGVKAPIRKADLLSIYTKTDLAYSIAKTGLSSEKAQQLHDAIHRALVQGIRCQSLEKVKIKLQEAISESDVNSAVMVLDLLARSDIPALEIPAIVLLQHEEKILLHPRQVSALKELLAVSPDGRGFNEVVEKIIMGGGKSKVILPIQAEMKAQGGNLVIIEVPQALLETNYEDLNRTSQRLYGKRAYRFDFNRDSDVSVKRLEQVYATFVEVMINRNYLVTTGEAMQSLELKYIELLQAKDPIDAVLEQQIYWLDKITALVRHHGDCIIDEAHQGLSIKKRLNYNSADTQPVSTEAIKNVVALYKLIDYQFIAKAPYLSPDYDWAPFKNELANKLLSDKRSPLFQFAESAIQTYGKNIKEDLVSYLTNNAPNACLAIVYAKPEEKEMLGFFKQEVSVLLPQTLVRNLDEHYGASKRKGLSAIEQTLALPYAANNVANERSRFGNQLESLNYTAQMMLIHGINQKLLMQKIEQCQAEARKELFQDARLKNVEETPTAKGFSIWIAQLGLKLSDINLKDSEQLQKLHAHLQYNTTLIFDILQKQALGLVQQEGETISSNSFNHVDMYRSAQAVSGTPSNHSTFHQRLNFNKASSLGTDGYIIEVIHSKNTPINGDDYKSICQFIETVLTDSAAPQVAERTRAIIDICATFRGISNIDVAKEVARFYHHSANNTIKHVLYFDENQVLCALDINKPTKPIVLKTTDEKEISRLLGSVPSERFTYYDQSHTTGTDISQAKNAHAVVLIDEKTSLQAFLQGSMRMRELSLEQTMKIIVPKHLQDIKREALICKLAENDNLNLLNDNLTAAKLQMSNLIRRQCLTVIRDLPSEEIAKKRQLAKFFKSFLVDKPSDSFYELYGALNKKQSTTDILNRHKKKLLERWKTCIASASIIHPISDNESIDANLQAIIDNSLPNCLKEYDSAENSTFAMEVEIQAENEIEKEIEVAVIRDFFDLSLAEQEVIELASTDKAEMDNYSLEFGTDLFSKQLRASKNYAMVYWQQTQCINGFLKPAWVTWYYMQEGKLCAMIVTPQEAEKLIEIVESKQIKGSWFATNLDTVVGGKRPKGMLKSEEYLTLREQVRFFNGNIPTLLNQNTFYWLKDRTTEKLEFFKRNLMPYRPESAEEFPQLETLLLQAATEGFTYIARHRFEDLSEFDWNKIFPKIFPAQSLEYTKVAEAFTYINQHWDKEKLDIKQLEIQFDLPLAALGYVEEHLQLLTIINNIVDYLVESNGSNTFISKLNAGEATFLEEYFGIPLKEFAEQNKPAIDFNALLLLRMHPALKGTKKKEKLNHLILQNAFCNKAIITTLLDSSDNFSEEAWQIIIGKRWNDEEAALIAEKILSRRENNLPEFVIDYVWNQCKKSESLLIHFAKLANNTALFNRIFSEHKANDLICASLLGNPLFSPEKLLFYFLEHNSEDVDGLMPVLQYFNFPLTCLIQCIDHVKTSKQLQDILAHAHQDILSYAYDNVDLLLKVLAHKKCSVDLARQIIGKVKENPSSYKELIQAIAKHVLPDNPEKFQWEEMLLLIGEFSKKKNLIKTFGAALQGMKLDKDIQLKLLTHFGNDVIRSLAFADMVNECTENEVEELLNLATVEYIYDHILDLLVKVGSGTAAQTIQLLNRPEMTSSIAETLFRSPHYNYKLAIGNG